MSDDPRQNSENQRPRRQDIHRKQKAGTGPAGERKTIAGHSDSRVQSEEIRRQITARRARERKQTVPQDEPAATSSSSPKPNKKAKTTRSLLAQEGETQPKKRSHRRPKKQDQPSKLDPAQAALPTTQHKAKDLSYKASFSLNVVLKVIMRLAWYAFLIVILLGGMGLGTGMGYFAYLVSQTEPPSREEMAQEISQLDEQSSLHYSNGDLIANIQSDVVRSAVPLDTVSPYIIDGFIATEDEYFYDHPGVVPKAIVRAALETILTGSGTGGSTLTQQLVKQSMLSHDVTFFRKANEILLALRMENYFSKDEILEAYLNVSPFGRNNSGDNIAGVAKATEGIFGVSPDQVSLSQAAFIAGLPQDPYSYTPYQQSGQLRSPENLQAGVDRMKEVLFRMYRDERISREEYEQASHYDITQDFIQPAPKEKEHLSHLYQSVMHGAIEELMKLNIETDNVDWHQVWQDAEWYNDYYFKAEDQLRRGGYKVYSTIDKRIYDQLQTSAKAYEDELGVSYDGVYTDPDTGYEQYYVEKVQTGLVVIDNQSGRVLGFVAGTDYENNQIDHAFRMRRSPGSTIKPLAVYGPAIQHNLINPSTIIPDTAYVQEFADGSTWTPTNYGGAVSGQLMTARVALERSDNLPAVRIYEELLNQNIPIIDYLELMGFNTVDSYTEEDTNNLAFSLGGVTTGPTVFEETRAFTTFANQGQYIDGYYIDRIEDSQGKVIYQHDADPVNVFSEDTNYLMVDMLRGTLTNGTGRTARSNMVMGGDWIMKTGISENSKDVWVIGSTPAITIGSWIGYDSRYDNYTIDVNDGFGLESVRSQIYWTRIINDLYELRPEIFGIDLTFRQPDSVTKMAILPQTGTQPGSFQFNGQTFSMTQPLVEELFKVSNPAPPLNYNFIFGASDDELAYFWQQIRSVEEQRRVQERSSENVDEDKEEDESQGSSVESESALEVVDPANPNG